LRRCSKVTRPLGLKAWDSTLRILSPESHQIHVAILKTTASPAWTNMDLKDALKDDAVSSEMGDFPRRTKNHDSKDFLRQSREFRTKEENEKSEDSIKCGVNECLSNSVTKELEDEIIGDKLGLKFALKQALSEINNLEKKQMPLPTSMELLRWKQLISLTDFRARFHFLEALTFETMTYEEILALDEKMSNPIEISEEMIVEAVGEDEEARKKINLYLMHVEFMRQNGEIVPYELRLKDLKEISGLRNQNQMKKHINFLNSNWFKKNKDTIRKRKTQMHHPEKKNQKKEDMKTCEHLYYGLGANIIQLRLGEDHFRRYYNWQGIREFNIGTPLVVDFSYIKDLHSKRHVKGVINKEANLAIHHNRSSHAPFALHFTGVEPDLREKMEALQSITDENRVNMPVEITEKHQLDLFPKEKLVYLSPDSRNDLMRYNDDDIYVIGGIIDKGDDRAPLTLANAKKERIRHARFPMKKVIGVSADLNVETCVAIMNDLKASQDWFYALRWVPARFFANRLRTGHSYNNKAYNLEEQKLQYRAHKALSPTSNISSEVMERNRRLTAKQYRTMYTKVMQCKTLEEMNILLETLKI